MSPSLHLPSTSTGLFALPFFSVHFLRSGNRAPLATWGHPTATPKLFSDLQTAQAQVDRGHQWGRGRKAQARPAPSLRLSLLFLCLPSCSFPVAFLRP